MAFGLNTENNCSCIGVLAHILSVSEGETITLVFQIIFFIFNMNKIVIVTIFGHDNKIVLVHSKYVSIPVQIINMNDHYLTVNNKIQKITCIVIEEDNTENDEFGSETKMNTR